MTSTLTPEQTQALLAAIPKIEQAGGPKWNDWCDIKTQCVRAHQSSIRTQSGWRYCAPAVAAAVIAWAANLHKWAYSQGFGGRLCLVSCGTATVLDEAIALISAVAEGLEGA